MRNFDRYGCKLLLASLLILAANAVDFHSGTRETVPLMQSTLAAETTAHPLDPLGKEELESAVQILKTSGKLSKNVSLVSLALAEPSKSLVASFKEGDKIERNAFALLYNIDTNETSEVTVDLIAGEIAASVTKTGEQPMQLDEDTPMGIEILSANPEWMKGLQRRGITDMRNVHMEMFVVGNPIGINNPKKERLLRAYPYYRVVGNNEFGEPIEGLSALVNMTTKKAEVTDSKDIIPLAGAGSNYFDPKNVGELRKGANPLITTQPNGPSFEIHGHEIRWQNWSFRFAIDPREGLVLHKIAYEDQKKVRPILYRAGVSEVSVPYGAPGAGWVWRSPIDEGEYGLGRLTTTLRPGHEVPSHATVLDMPYANSVGTVKIKPAALAIWEQDGGILWEHHDDDSDKTATRRARQLVIAHMFTLGNYDYFIQWHFNQDGSMEPKVTLNGDVLTQGVSAKDCQVCATEPDEEGRIMPTGVERYGTLLAPNVVGINHQHFFCFRLDFDLDGAGNSVYEMNVRPVNESRGHLEQNTFIQERTLLRREEDARRDLNAVSNRAWKIFSPTAPKYLGHYPGYLLEPGANAFPYSHEDSYIRKRSGFLKHHLWVTEYKPDEMHAAGEYPVSSIGGQGLPTWSNDAPITDKDIVLWYTVGITHIPRVEDWPVMPSAHMGFKLVPEDFFKRNPSLDLPDD